jgi:hypothetical protein
VRRPDRPRPAERARGALTALGALIPIRREFIPGLSALDSQEQILAYALVFGYA